MLRLRTLFVFLSLLMLAAPVLHAQPSATEITADDLAAFEAIIEAEMDTFAMPGAAVAVISGDEIVYAKGFGVRDLASGAPFTTETRFRIGSTTKSMTSMLIAMLVDEGLVTWDTPVADIFPAFQTGDPDRTAQITVRDLMGMGTGLVSSPLDGLYWGEWDFDALLNAIANQQIGGDFREFYSYNNEVYALAGYAAAQISGAPLTVQGYADLLAARVFEPVGMASALVTDDVSALGEDYAESYEMSLLTGEPLLMTPVPIGMAAPAGAVWVNIEDMARYVITQMNGGVTPDGEQIVSADNLAETWAAGVSVPFDLPGISGTAYGMGWLSQTYNDLAIRYHDGGWMGYSTQMMVFPEADAAVIVFANSTNGSLFGISLTYSFAELLGDFEPAAVELVHEANAQLNEQIEGLRPLVSMEIGDLSAVVGDYEQGWAVEQRDDGSLWLIRGDWMLQAGYIEAIDQYVLINGGAAGTLFSFDTEADPVTISVQLGGAEALTLAKVE